MGNQKDKKDKETGGRIMAVGDSALLAVDHLGKAFNKTGIERTAYLERAKEELERTVKAATELLREEPSLTATPSHAAGAGESWEVSTGNS